MIFFDIDGTLIDHESAERSAALTFQKNHAHVFPETPDDFAARWHYLAEKYIHRHFAGELTFQGQRCVRMRELFSHHAQLTDIEADVLFREYLKLYEENWRIYSDVKACLDHLSKHALGIISNGKSSQQRKKLEILGIAEKFSVITISGDIGVAKPAAGIFKAACEIAGRQPHECVYVGDDLESDVQGSMQVGIHAVWLNRKGVAKPEGIVTIQTLADFSKVIRSHTSEIHSLSVDRANPSLGND